MVFDKKPMEGAYAFEDFMDMVRDASWFAIKDESNFRRGTYLFYPVGTHQDDYGEVQG